MTKRSLGYSTETDRSKQILSDLSHKRRPRYPPFRRGSPLYT